MLTRNLFRRPRIALEDAGTNQPQRPEIPGELYSACPKCKAMHAADVLDKEANVCPKCGHHFRIGARRRIELIADAGSFTEMWGGMKAGDPIEFKGYREKLEQACAQSGENEGVIAGECAIGGEKCCIFAMEPGFIMGSMGCVVGEKITRLFEYALEKKMHVVGCCVSGGARMQEGVYSLMQMAKTTGAVKRHSDGGLLFIAVLSDPTTGGVMASFAMEGDITIAEPGALIGFAGPRVIEQTIRQKLKEGFQRSEFLLEKGFLDMICDRRELKAQLSTLLRLHRREAGA
ncbi:MAG: acetyl-CoA carboxylase carboxyltransferase subunit beta [Clostridia bacterium]|nr:acetyl-CoA carboxylase carboxyltransferase subunit beta [Clostridia bacterium]